MNLIKSDIRTVTAFAPATCANVAVGFDIMGFAIETVGDTVTLAKREDKKIIIESIESSEPLPLEIEKNTASAVIQNILSHLQINQGFSISIKKGIPLSSGMGGSAASAVAALTAFNAFLEHPLSREKLVEYALIGEEISSGQQHADNIVPCLLGGITLIQSLDPLNVIALPIPGIYCVLVHPHLQVSTRQARSILKDSISLKDHVVQSANLAACIAAFYQKNIDLLQTALKDILIEPQRAQFVPGFYKVKEAALQAGAVGVSLSGSGPSMFAFAKTKQDAEAISSVMRQQLMLENIDSDFWISEISKNGAYVHEVH